MHISSRSPDRPGFSNLRKPEIPARPARAAHAAALLAFAFLLVAPPAQAADPVFPTAFRLGLVPPPGFVPSPNFHGFQHSEKQANILMAELPDAAFEALEKEVAAELQKEQPAQTAREDVTLKDGKGFVLFARPPSGPQGTVLKWTMIAKVSGVTAVVTAMMPEAVHEAIPAEAIRNALATLTVRTVPVDEQLAALPFALDQLAGFRIVRVQPGSAAMLTDGPKDAVEAVEQPLLLVSIMPQQTQPQPQERDGLARRLLGDIPGLKEAKVTRSEPLRVAGQQGYEIQIEAKDARTSQDVNAVQWLRFGTGTLLRVVGIARKDAWPESFRRFREVRDGIGPK